jgi:hypothetical protein
MEALKAMYLARPIATSLASSSAHGAHRIASHSNAVAKGASTRRPLAVRAAATHGDTKEKKSYKVTVLPGDGIGPEIIGVAVDVLRLVGSQEGGSQSFHETLRSAVQFRAILGFCNAQLEYFVVGNEPHSCWLIALAMP